MNAGLTQVLQDGMITYLNGVNRIAQVAETQTGFFLPDALGSVRNIIDENGEITLNQSYTPYGEVMASEGTAQTAYAFTGEMHDPQTGLVFLRARYMDVNDGLFLSRDTWQGDYNTPMSYNAWLYGYANPVMFIDPSGHDSIITILSKVIDCSIGDWDCEAVTNVAKLKQVFLDSASRHNRIPTMDNNGFAGLIASTIVSERRIGNVPVDGDDRDRESQRKEDLLASFGCTVSGHFVKQALDSRDWNQFLRYLLNLDVPQRATVGIGNVWLETGANLWKGQTCSSLGDCTAVSVSKMQTRNIFGQIVDINNPFGTQLTCAYGSCVNYQPEESESYVRMTYQLLNQEINIEYVAANLEAGALRAFAKGYKPTAFNSASWHLWGVQTDEEIQRSGWNPDGAIWILNHIPIALTAMGITSTWNAQMEPQYGKYKQEKAKRKTWFLLNNYRIGVHYIDPTCYF